MTLSSVTLPQITILAYLSVFFFNRSITMLNTRVLTFTVMFIHKNGKYCIFQFGNQSDIIYEVRQYF